MYFESYAILKLTLQFNSSTIVLGGYSYVETYQKIFPPTQFWANCIIFLPRNTPTSSNEIITLPTSDCLHTIAIAMRTPWKAPAPAGKRGKQPATPSGQSVGQPPRHQPPQQHHQHTSCNIDTSRKRHRIWSVTWSRIIFSMSRQDGGAIHTLSAGGGGEISVELPRAVEVNIGCAPALSTLSTTVVFHLSGHSNYSHP